MVSGMPEQWSTAEFSLYPSCLLVFFHLLSIVTGYCWVAQLFLHSFLDYRLTQGRKKKKEQSPTSFLLSGSGEILIHMIVYHASYTAAALLTQHHLSPAVLSKCLFSISHLKYCLAFCSPSPVFPLNSIILKTNASCRKKHHSCWEHHPL